MTQCGHFEFEIRREGSVLDSIALHRVLATKKLAQLLSACLLSGVLLEVNSSHERIVLEFITILLPLLRYPRFLIRLQVNDPFRETGTSFVQAIASTYSEE